MHRITLRIAVGNRASERVAEKLGFTQEGLLRKEVLVHGVWLDHTLWALLEEEFRRELPRWVEMGWVEGLGARAVLGGLSRQGEGEGSGLERARAPP